MSLPHVVKTEINKKKENRFVN